MCLGFVFVDVFFTDSTMGFITIESFPAIWEDVFCGFCPSIEEANLRNSLGKPLSHSLGNPMNRT